MSSVATPPPVAPPVVTPAPVVPVAPVVAPKTTVHSHEDAIYNRIAEKMTASVNAQAAPTAIPPAPSSLVPPLATPGPPVAATTSAVPVEAAPVVPEAPSLDLENIDFDAPDEPKPVEVPADGTKLLSDTEISTGLQEMLDRGELPDKIEAQFLKHSRGKQMLESYKTLRELRKSPEEGGIGRIPTLDEIKVGEKSLRVMQAMDHEKVNNPISFIHNLFVPNPETGASFIGQQAEIQTILHNIPNVLLNQAQEGATPAAREQAAALYGAYSAPVFTKFFDHQYKAALAMPQNTDQERADKGRVLDGLQISEYKAFGSARPLELNGNNAGAPSGAPDHEKAQLQARLRQYEQQFTHQQQTQQQQLTSRVENEGRDAALGDIGKLFNAAGVTKVHSDAILAPHRTDLYEQIKSTLPQLDPGGWQTYQLQMQQVTLGRVDPSVPAKTYRLLFQNALRNSPQVRTRITALVQDAHSSSDADHAARAQSQTRVDTGAAGTPAPQSVLAAGQIARQPGETREEFMARRISTSMTSKIRPS